MQTENELEKDKAAVLAVLRAETDAWLRRDLVALSSHWLHAPYARRMSSVAYHGAQVQEGWDAIFAALSDMAVQFPQSFAESRVRWEGMNIVVNGDTAWASYDQVGEKTDDEFEMVGTQHELKIFHRVEGQWKLVSIVVMQRTIDHEVCPMIEITKDKTVLWMNAQAHEQINTHPLLFVQNSKLRARERPAEASLQKAVEWATGQLHWHTSQSTSRRPAHPVILGDSSTGAPVYCWVLLEDGKIMVSFNDLQLLKRLIAVA